MDFAIEATRPKAMNETYIQQRNFSRGETSHPLLQIDTKKMKTSKYENYAKGKKKTIVLHLLLNPTLSIAITEPFYPFSLAEGIGDSEIAGRKRRLPFCMRMRGRSRSSI